MNSLDELKEIWQAVYSLLSKDFSSSTLELWFGGIRLVYLDDEVALMTIDKDFKKEFIDRKYIDILKDHFYMCLGFEVETEIFSDAKIETPEEAAALYERYKATKTARDEAESKQEMESAIKVISPEKKSTSYFTFENFIQYHPRARSLAQGHLYQGRGIYQQTRRSHQKQLDRAIPRKISHRRHSPGRRYSVYCRQERDAG